MDKKILAGLSEELLASFKKNSGYFLAWGIILVLLGTLAIIFSTATTLISVMIIGLLLLFGGIIVLIDAFQFWWRKGWQFFLHALIGVLYIIAGFILIRGPATGAISLTLFLGSFFIVVGVLRIFYSLSVKVRRWGWNLFSGIMSLLLGLLILAGWPESGLFILGLFVGIDLLMIGWAYIMISLAAKTIDSK